MGVDRIIKPFIIEAGKGFPNLSPIFSFYGGKREPALTRYRESRVRNVARSTKTETGWKREGR